MSCKVCEELASYNTRLEITEFEGIDDKQVFYAQTFMPIKYCPSCGNRLKEVIPEKYKNNSKKGHWIHYDDYDAVVCNLCGYELPDNIYPRLPYCPKCAADMDLNKEETK